LKEVLPEASFTGLGGTEMEQAGQVRTIRAEDVAVMGITEILRHIPHIYRSYRRLVVEIKRNRPDVAVLIDFPDVNFRLAKHLHRAGVPVLWFVSPQLWAWKRSRLRWVQKRVMKMFVIFPFEEEFYRNRGVDATFTGHPLADLPLPTITREEYASQHGLDPKRGWIALLPGSRLKELRANLPEMLKAARLLSENFSAPREMLPPSNASEEKILTNFEVTDAKERLSQGWWQFILPVASTLHESDVQEIIDAGEALPPIHLVDDARAALHNARASVVASGTATVQAALIGNPFLVVYRVSDLTFRLAKRLIRYPAEIPSPEDQYGNLPIAMPNLIAGRRIVPELLQNHLNAKEIAEILNPLLQESTERAAQMADLAALRKIMKPDYGKTAIIQLRDAVLQSLGLRR
jgi:lipid-A-disaccharide synthase